MGSNSFVRPSSVLSILALLLLAHGAAGADPAAPPPDRERARTLMDEGHSLKDKGNHDAALKSFMAADDIMHVPTTSLAVARELLALGRLVEAESALLTLVRTQVKAKEPEPFTRARVDAQTLLAELGPRVPTLEILVLHETKGVTPEVSVDGAVLSQAARLRPIKVNPGQHVIAATAGAAHARLELVIGEGEARPVSLELKTEPMAATPPPLIDTTATEPATAVRPNPLRPYLFWGGAGLAGAGLIAGTITGIMSLSATSASQQGCVGNQCPPPTWNDIDRGHTTATLANVSFLLAGVGAAAFGLSFVLPAKPVANTHGSANAGSATGGRVEPWIGAGSFGVRGSL